MLRFVASASAIGLMLALAPAATAMQGGFRIDGPTLLHAVQYAALSADYSIANVQDALNRLGYDAGTVDGVLGQRTATAIREFQSAQGLAVTGRATPALYEKLLAALGRGTQTGAVTTGSVYAQTPSRELITEIQSELRQAGYNVPAVTGTLDDETRAAIREYQRVAGVQITGEPSQRMLDKLRRHTAARGGAQQRELVQQIQRELNARGYDAGVADGILGPGTRTAIRTYQSDAGLAVTGEPTPTLLARLQSASREAGAPSPPAEPALVRQVQSELNQRGYDLGDADGVVGERTRMAIRDYQQRMGMAVTGEPSVELLASLQQSDRPPADRQAERDAVRLDIEQALGARGYAVGAIDGDIDQQSRAAIRQYQRDAGIEVDGRADQQLLAHIQSSSVRARTTSGAASPVDAIERWLNEKPR